MEIVIFSLIIAIILFSFLLYNKRRNMASGKLKYYKEQLNKIIDSIKNKEDTLSEKNSEIDEKNKILDKLNISISVAEINKNNLQNQIDDLIKNCIRTKEFIEKSLEENAKISSEKFQEAEMLYQQEYLKAMEERTNYFTNEMRVQQNELSEIQSKIEEEKNAYLSIIKSKQLESKILDHTLQIPEEDLNDINKIREVIPYIKNQEILNKLIWTSYYQKPYQDLISKVLPNKTVCGIYKITCLLDETVYIGQSVDIKRRWGEHIKRGLGAEAATKNKLYLKMKKCGVENFSFELLEETPREKLNEREKFYIDFYKSNLYGLNGNEGNS